MKKIFQNYSKILLTAGLILSGLTILLVISKTNITIINPENVPKALYIIILTLVFITCWLFIAFLIFKFSINKILGLASLLFITIVLERYLPISKNPITVPLIILFWLGLANLFLTKFFQKYKYIIIGVYGLVIVYFLIIFYTTANFDSQNRERFAGIMLLPIPVFLLLWAYEHWRWLQTLKIDKAKTELSLLKSQINPHFFFNTLNNLYGLVLEKSDKAPQVILKLSDMLRYTIYKGEEEYVLLKDEIRYLEDYIELHKIRYQKKVDIVFNHNVEESLQITPLTFIVLLENAFKHGVEKMRRHAFIDIKMKSEKNQLFFTLKNNFDPTISIESHGIGLVNLKKRLVHSYPEQHKLIFEQKEGLYTVNLIINLK